MEDQQKIKRVLFYAGGSYGFRSMPIWYFFEVCQKYPTVLLSEKLDPEIEAAINNKEFFPKLEKIAYLPEHSLSSYKTIIKKNKILYNEAKEAVSLYKPDIVFVGGKNLYPFSLYLRRISKKAGALNICILGPQLFSPKQVALWSKMSIVYSKGNFYLNLFLTNIKKQIGHFIYYIFLPLTVGEKPFFKEPGCVLFKNNLGRTADYYISFSKKEYEASIKEGMPSEKLYIVNPYPKDYGKVRSFLKERFVPKSFNPGSKVLTIMWPDLKIGIKKENSELISKEEMERKRKRVLELILENLNDWQIYIKPHPGIKEKDFLEIKNIFGSISQKIKVTKPLEWADAYTERSDAIIGFPPASITIYTASLICPEKPILFLDFDNELLGDCYKYFNRVEYINNEENLVNALRLIQNNNYKKPNYEEDKTKSNLLELMDKILK